MRSPSPLSPLVALMVLFGFTAPPAADAADPRAARVGLQKVLSGLSGPVGMAPVPGATSRYVIAERAGRLRMVRNGVLQSRPFLDISGRVKTAGEAGLLSVAFQPDYASSGRFFVCYVHTDGTLRVSRFSAVPSADVAGGTETVFLAIPHPTYDNHYGGQLAFGPNAYLYISTGDGGGSGDPAGNAQSLGTLLGKVLRIDVTRGSNGRPYAIPPSNPFATSTTVRREIFHYGLRNPWRFSFDRADGTLYLADVGQFILEEVDVLGRGMSGRNLGWDCREGTRTTTYGGSYCSGRTFTNPVHQYNHDWGCAVIGGYVYRGSRYSSLIGGVYLYGDFCSGRIWGLARQPDGRWINAQMYDVTGNILAFGQDASGEVYVLHASGTIYRIIAASR